MSQDAPVILEPHTTDMPSLKELEAIEEELATLSAHIESAKYRLLTLIRSFDEGEGWARQGFVSCAQFLGYRIGLGGVAAREHVRVARALPELPQISEAMQRGELSFSKVRALTRVARPDTEGELLSIAKAGTAAHVEKVVRAIRRANGPADSQTAERQYQERHLQLIWTDDGLLDIRGRLPAELGAVVQKALELALEKAERTPDTPDPKAGQGDQSQQPTSTHGQRMADALVQVAESALAADIARGVPAERVQVVIHACAETNTEPAARIHPDVSAETRDESAPRLPESALQVHPIVSAETKETPPKTRARVEAIIEPGGAGLAEETTRRLCCDASVVRDDGSEDRTAQRKKRLPNLPLRRALARRDRSCVFVGCNHERYLQAHHIAHWIDGGETTQENLVLLCSYHHHLLHEGGFQLKRDGDGQLHFYDPTGRELSETPPPLHSPNGPVALNTATQEEGLSIDAHTMPLWQGERMDPAWMGIWLRTSRS